MATYTFDKIEYNNNIYVVSDSGALQLTGGQVTGPVTFGDLVTIDEATLGDLVVNGSASFTNNIQANTINGVTVGSSPKFTDTDTKVTSSANHYTPSTASGNDKTASASGATAAWSIDVVKGITINTDGKGHITGLSVTSGKIPANPNSDTWRKVQLDGTDKLGTATSTNPLNLKAGTNVSITESSGTFTFSATDTDTKVTSSANHYTPSTASGNDKTASASGATAAWSIDVVKGITINTDGKGHITGLSVTSGKIPSNPNTDVKVKQLAAITTAGAYPIILAYSTATTEETNSVNKTSTLTYNPNTKALVTGGTVDGYTLAAASAKSVVTSIDTSASLPTSNAVKTFVENKGYTTNTGTVTKVIAGTGLAIGTTAQGEFTTSGTINHTNSVTAQTTQAVYPIKIDAQGHISAYGSAVTPITSVKQDGVTGATGNHYGACSTAAGTAAKTVSITAGTPTLEAGLRVAVKFANANTAGTPTLNVNSLGAKNIFHNGAQITTGGNKALLAGTVEFIYDGTQWQLVGNYIDTDTKAWGSITGKPTATGSNTTGITASTTATKTTLGTAFTIPNVTSVGSASTWAFTGVTVANSIVGEIDSTDSTQLNISVGTTTVQSKSSGGNGTAPSLGTAFTVPNVTGNTSATVSITDSGHTHSIS